MSEVQPLWYNSKFFNTIAKSIAGILTTFGVGLGIYFATLKDVPPSPKESGNLTEFVMGAYSDRMTRGEDKDEKHDEEIKAIKDFLSKQEGSIILKENLKEELEKIKREHARTDANRDFDKSYYAPQKITILVNKLTGKVYYDSEDGNRHPLSWRMRDGNRVYFIRQNGVNIEL